MLRSRLTLIALVAAFAAWGSGTASASTFAKPSLNPFRSESPGAADGRRLALDPVSTDAPVTPAAAPPSAPVACQSDADCPDENICDHLTCRRIEHRVNVLYLYYQDGTFREIMFLYWAKRGNTGFRVLAPFYWHYFSPTSRSRIIAPFYWHFEDDVARSETTVIVPGLPISWSRQPGASSFGIWPLFYKSTKFGWAAPLLGTFKIADPDKGTSFGALGFLYWWTHSPARSWDLLLPIFVSRRSPEKAFTFALPLNFYWRSGSDAHTLAFPLFLAHSWKQGSSLYSLLGYYSHQGTETRGSVAWLYWGGRNRTTENAYDILFPLLWSFRSPKSSTTTFLGLVWNVRRDDTYFKAAFPLWWSAGNDSQGWRFRTLLPFFYASQSEHGTRSFWISPLGGYARNDAAQSRTLFLWPAPLLYRRDPATAADLITPLYFRLTEHAADITTRLIGLLYFRRSEPSGTTNVLFPLFWRFHDAASGRATTALLPFFLRRNGARDTLTAAGIFPLWGYHRTYVDGGWSAGLFPLAFFGKRGNGDSGHGVVFPLFWHFASAKGSTTALLPLFYFNRDRSGYDFGSLPLVFFGRNHVDKTSYQVQFPLFWRFTDERAQTSTAVTPLGFFGTSPNGWHLGVGPLLPIVWAAGGGPRRHFVLFPILWHFRDDAADKSTTVFANYLHRSHGDETTDALFPLVYYRRGARPGGTPETSFTLFPLIHYRNDPSLHALITPVGAFVNGRERQGGFVGPYFWYHGKTFTARGIPGLFADVTRSDTGERTRQWGPVVAIDAPGRKARVVFPLFGQYRDDKETDTFVFPSYFRQRKTDGSYAVDSFLPLFWHSNWQGRTTTVVGPYYDREGLGVHNTGLVPFYFWAKNADRTLLCIPPLLTFHRHDFRAGTSLTWAGPFYHSESAKRATTVLFPFYWAGREGDAQGDDANGRDHRIVLPFYWHFRDGQKADSTLLIPFYWSTRGTTRLRAILPIAWYTRDDVTKSGSEAVLPLFYASHGPDRFSLYTLPFGISRTPTSRRFYVGPVYASDSVESSARVIFPLYFSHLNRKTETRTRFVLPALYFSRANPEKSLTTVLALFWRRADVSSATTLLFPFLLDVHDFRQSRTTVLLPFFVRHANEVTGESLWLMPLYYRHVTATTATNVLFPLLWDFKSEGRRTTILFPLFAHWTRAAYTGTWIFPNIYYRKGLLGGEPDGTWRFFVPPLFDAAVQRPGDFRWDILAGMFGSERIGRNRYMTLFFYTFETKKAAATQTSWYGQPRRPSRVHPARGLATNAW